MVSHSWSLVQPDTSLAKFLLVWTITTQTDQIKYLQCIVTIVLDLTT